MSAGVHPTSLSLELAREMGHIDVADLIAAILGSSEEATVTESRRTAGVPKPAPSTAVNVVDVQQLERSRAHWDDAFATSTPLLVRGCGDEISHSIRGGNPAQLRRIWGDRTITVCYSEDAQYHRPWFSDDGAHRLVLRKMPTETMTFDSFIDRLPYHGMQEFFAVSQSPSESLDEFVGLTGSSGVPPALAALLGKVNRKNLWVCSPPKLSALHYDEDDSVLLQLSGTKRFTLIAPYPLHGLAAYPTVLPIEEYERLAPGVYQTGQEATDRVARHFPLVNVTHPDFERHPLFRHARTVTVDVGPGDALLLPAYWYHQVERFAPEAGALNVAVNVWFESADVGGSATRLNRMLRERLYVHL